MMKRIIWLLTLFVSASFANAQNTDELFNNANNLYKNGSYKEAAKIYESLIASKTVSSELFYNLGNCYYKLNKVGPSIYNYEKALLLDPLNEDAKNNLVFAKRLTLDRIEELPKSVLQKFNENYISKISFNGWAVVSVIISFLASILFILYYFSLIPSRKRIFFTTSILLFLILIISLAITYHQYSKFSNTVEAIIFSDEASVKNEPTKNGDEVFLLHEGTKVIVLDEVDDWKKIRLVDGKIGWLKNDNIKILDLF
ncbi:SH3 domain-containing protein [Tenacibaculum jejuense]|uniref:Aerotolerance-related exported protein n=1 Tax=Tenacibaculum jejuense TaxID=584609 RepID=A0A238UG23_9FLAO|nr:tetratricopeptide repeat protein [Tenacibaculum jejuense]SNR17394.1 Aerotolerance-related exported protein [Tenacibaculum jejuense]